jgi:bifunctional DNA-binding transcriptional regulator/antitoxin component of YhaV-PrlF toxin-antitoxin module
MLAKVTAKNQLTLPKRIVEALGNPPYFAIRVEGSELILSPARPDAAAAAREKIAALGISQEDIAAAVSWVRRR